MDKEKEKIIDESQKLNKFYKYLMRLDRDLEKLGMLAKTDRFSDPEKITHNLIKYEIMHVRDEYTGLYDVWKSITTIRALINGLRTETDAKMLEILHSMKDEYNDCGGDGMKQDLCCNDVAD